MSYSPALTKGRAAGATGAGRLLGPVLRRRVLEQSRRANVGHIGSALSVADLVAAVARAIDDRDPTDPGRDRFVLSKGHAALALYAALAETTGLGAETLDSYCADDSILGVHPDHALRGVDFSTGSLGHGLSFAVGAALGAVMQGSGRRTFAIVSDAECNEGVVWEAAMFAAQHRLWNLTVLIDHNHQQAFGYTTDILASESIPERWRSFGWETSVVDGHDEVGLLRLLCTPPGNQPRAVVAETTFGKGVSFMEGQIKWHYLALSEPEYEQAMKDIGGHG